MAGWRRLLFWHFEWNRNCSKEQRRESRKSVFGMTTTSWQTIEFHCSYLPLPTEAKTWKTEDTPSEQSLFQSQSQNEAFLVFIRWNCVLRMTRSFPRAGTRHPQSAVCWEILVCRHYINYLNTYITSNQCGSANVFCGPVPESLNEHYRAWSTVKVWHRKGSFWT